MITQIKEYIQFGDFNSKDAGWYLQSRDAPTPDKKEIVEQIPYLQGVLDFSDVLGEVFFDRREITYEFKLPNKDYPDRKLAERFIKSSMATKSDSQLFDTHVKSIKVTDVPLKKHLIATIVFICYPFAFHVDNYFDDVWDTFDFENDFSNWTKWQINGQNEIFFINGGDTSVSPTVICSSDISLIDKKGKTYKFKKGENTDFVLSMKPGMNRFAAKGNGSISLRFNAEVMA